MLIDKYSRFRRILNKIEYLASKLPSFVFNIFYVLIYNLIKIMIYLLKNNYKNSLIPFKKYLKKHKFISYRYLVLIQRI